METDGNAVDVTDVVLAWLRDNFKTVDERKWSENGSNGRVLFRAGVEDQASVMHQVAHVFPRWHVVNEVLGSLADYSAVLFRVIADHVDGATQMRSHAESFDPTTSPSHLEREFTRPYHGLNLVPVRLEAYVTACWNDFCEGFPVRPYPYTTIVQSSGFGKSRLLRELAVRTQATTGNNAHMKVLYVCVRDDTLSSGYPVATTHLRDYLFPLRANEQDLASRLCDVFDTAIHRWDLVGREWLKLFTDEQADVSVSASFKKSKQVRVPPSARLPHNDASQRRILVLAVDEASALLQPSAGNTIGWFRTLRRALRLAHESITKKYGRYAGIFAVLVDTNSKISNFVPPPSTDGSGRGRGNQSILFPPFVLTHTMDIHFDNLVATEQAKAQTESSCIRFYQDHVCSQSHEEYLASMGRPLWKSRLAAMSFDGVIQLAATKLLKGLSPLDKGNLNEESLFGVSSMLCRVGLRPYASSLFASRIVADFMAVLSYVNCQKDHWTLATYASEPMLTFGASRVWYQAAPQEDHFKMLGERILPQLRKLLPHEVMDTGGAGELAARILLLLAIDTIGAMETGSKIGRNNNGEFRSVWDFLEVLRGASTEVRDIFGKDKTAETIEELGTLQHKWSQWKIGFSHFVQLSEEPTKESLWAMLARRAAGTFPRNYKGVDLLLPIFRGGLGGSEPREISMVLIQVKNRANGDPAFPHSVSTAMHPQVVFTGDFKEYREADVVRVYLSLRTPVEPQRFYLIDPGLRRSSRRTHRESEKETRSFALCYHGLASSSVQKGDQPAVQFLSERVVSELNKLIEPWWQPAKLIQADLEAQSGSIGENQAAATLEEATRPFVESLLSTKWQRVRSERQIDWNTRAGKTKAARTLSAELEDDRDDASRPNKYPRSM